MHFYTVIHEAVIDGIFITALLLAIAYTQWHYWWRSWFGSSFMLLVLAIAGIRLQVIGTELQLQPGSTPAAVLKWTGLAAQIAALISLTALLARTIWIQIWQPVSQRNTDQARRYLKQTPGASALEIKKLLACWDTLRSRPDAPARPD